MNRKTTTIEMFHIILAGIDNALLQAWHDVFDEYEYLSVYSGSILDTACDAVVSPANSFGFMDGGLDYQLSMYFGWHVQQRLQEKIQQKHHGELLVGTAEIVPTDHQKIPYLISAPTMRVPMILTETVNVYLATRAVLLLIKYGVFDNGLSIHERVRTVAIPGMGTGVGRVSPKICARQMKTAIDDILGEQYNFPRLWIEAQRRHQFLYTETIRDLQLPEKEAILKTLNELKLELLKRKEQQ